MTKRASKGRQGPDTTVWGQQEDDEIYRIFRLDDAGRLHILADLALPVNVLSIAAGVNLIGTVSIDQTTPGTTNAVNVPPVKTIESELKAITAVAANVQSVSSILNVSAKKFARIFIDHAKDAVGAAVGQGTEYVIEGSEKASGNDTWRPLARFTATITAPTAMVTDAQEAAGQTVIECGAAVPAVGDILFFKNGVLASSEWSNVIARVTTGGSETVTLQDALTNTQAQGTYYTQGEFFQVPLDVSALTRLRVVCNNTKGTTNQNIVWRCAAITES